MTNARVAQIAEHAEVAEAIRENYDVACAEVVRRLVVIARNIDQPWTRLTAAAYRKGLIVGLSHDYKDVDFPDCPYDGMHGNYARGGNDPRDAWRLGSLDGQRVRNIVLHPERLLSPALRQREFKALTDAMQIRVENEHPIGNMEAGVLDELVKS